MASPLRQGSAFLSVVARNWKFAVPVVIGFALLAATVESAPGTGREAGAIRDLAQVSTGRVDDSGAATVPDSQAAVTILAAGDIASCDSDGDERSAAVIQEHPGLPVLALGDLAYADGTAEQFRDCFDPSWGQFKSRIKPVPGNHEYYSANANPYFAYFGAAAGPSKDPASRGYYSFDLGAWHIVALNSEQDIGPNGAQLAWLRADLTAHPNACVLAYWHRPLFTAGAEYPTGFEDVRPFWDALQEAGAEIVLNGHDHSYQRYQPMTSTGGSSATGIREFVVGTGGRNAHGLLSDARREAAYSAEGFAGVLRLRLSPTGYEWTFLAGAGDSFTDSGSGQCH